MADLSKHRLEKDTFTVDFSSALASGEALSGGTATVAVTTKADGVFTDASSEFGSPTASVSGDEVQFTLSAAGTGEQDADTYWLRVKVETDNSHTLIATPTLEVTETADPSAP